MREVERFGEVGDLAGKNPRDETEEIEATKQGNLFSKQNEKTQLECKKRKRLSY